MKNVRRLLGLLLVLALAVGLIAIGSSAEEASPVVISTIATKGVLQGIPSVVAAEDITYLSDLYAGYTVGATDHQYVKYSYVVPSGSSTTPRLFARDTNFFGTRLYVFNQTTPGTSTPQRYEVKKGTAQMESSTSEYLTTTQGSRYHISDIAVGTQGWKYEKGLSFQPSAKTSSTPAAVIFDVSGQDADYFYAHVGITGEGNKATYPSSTSDANSRILKFELYGSKASAYSENMEFQQLAYVTNVRSYLSGEFNVNIEGYNYLKLVATSIGGTTSSAEATWANACVYKAPVTTATAEVKFDDTYNPTTIRPEGDLTAQLYADGVAVEGKTATINAASAWKCSFTDLAKYQDDLATEIVYTVGIAEDPALHRLVSNENGIITYQYDSTLTTIDLPVSLTWNDADAPDQSKRPSDVVVQLYADGAAVDGKTITLNTANEWKASFEKLPEKKRLSETETADIVYTLKVKTRSDNYTAKITDGTDGPVITMTYSDSIAVEFPTIGKSGTLSGIPSEATGANTHYLTDMLNGRNKRVTSQYIAGGGSYKAFENYEGQVQVIYGGGASQELVTEAKAVNGVNYNPTDIVLGTNGTVYSEGLSFMVSDPNADDTYITYDLTGMDATNFYAVAGITGTANDLIEKDCYLTFEVWGSKDGADFVKLGYADEVRSYLLAEFDVDITGYNYLKLTAYNTAESSEGASAVWADALVYCTSSGSTTDPSDPTDPTDPTDPVEPTIPGKYTDSADGSYTGIKAAEDSVVYLSEASAADAAKGKYITDYYTIHASNDKTKTPRYPTLDHPFGKAAGTAIVTGAGAEFSHGLGVLPSSAHEAQQNYILLDISQIENVDRFYAVTGLTGSGTKDGKSYGVVYEVYGSKNVVTGANDTSFEKLAVSGDVFTADSGEFDVDITGYKTLKLVTVTASGNASGFNSNCQSVWANACVYKYDENGTDPGQGGEEEKPGKLTDSGAVDTSKALNYTASADGSYKGITKAAENSYVALSDAKYVLDSYILPTSANPNRTVRIDTTNLNEDIASNAIIGAKKTGFAQHLTLHPTEKSNTKYAFVELDLTGLDVDRFYAAVGLHNKTATDSDIGVIFNVFAFDESKNDYVLIGTSSDVHGTESGEFDIDITGYQKLKLEVALASDAANHYSRISSWCDVAVYKYDENGSAPDVPKEDELPGVYTASSNGSYKWITNVKDGKVQYLSKMDYVEASNNNGNPTTNNYPYGEANKSIIIGQKNTKFTYGLGVHPKSGSSASYTIYDLTGLDVDRFYAAVGITNEKGKNGSSEGVTFRVYADFDGNGNYKLLAESDSITKKASGEFHVDITGAKSLKLVTLSTTGNHASSASAWANACVYKYDVNGSTPKSYTVAGASNATSTSSDNTSLKHIDGFIPSADGEYTGVGVEYSKGLTYLSDLTFKDASNTTNSAHPNGQPTTLDHPYNELTALITIGEMDRAFFKGLGVHPKNPSSPVDGSIESWTTYDVSDMNVDRFYAAVGLTNDKGKEGASKGVIFKVYADYEGNGSFELLSHSGCLSGRESGEFDLDITGVKTLKLAVVSASTTHTSSASAWGNACVYNSADVWEGVGAPEILEPSAKPETDATEPVADTTEPVDAPVEEKTIPVAVFIILPLVLLLIIGLLIFLLSKRKKSSSK